MIAIDLSQVPSSALTERVYTLRKKERVMLVELLQHLAEIERRKVHIEAGCDSMFTFLRRFLGYSKGSAFRRTKATELLMRFPVIASYLADGRLGLTTLVNLREVLDDETHLQTLDRAAGMNEDEILLLIATLRPRPAPPDLLRRLPRPAAEAATPPVATPTATPAPPPPPPAPSRAPRVEPISEELHTLRVTVGREFVADLKYVSDAMSHVIPDGDLVRVLHECLRRTRREIERRREGAAERPRLPAPPAAGGPTRTVSRAVRREVFARDGGRCVYVGHSGVLCGSTQRLQLHHLEPFAKGGPSTAANVSLRCAIHNHHHAEQDFGREHMERAIARAARGAGEQLTLV